MTVIDLRSILFTFSIFSRVESFRQEEYYVTLIDFTELSLRFDNFHLVFEIQLRLNFQSKKKTKWFLLVQRPEKRIAYKNSLSLTCFSRLTRKKVMVFLFRAFVPDTNVSPLLSRPLLSRPQPPTSCTILSCTMPSCVEGMPRSQMQSWKEGKRREFPHFFRKHTVQSANNTQVMVASWNKNANITLKLLTELRCFVKTLSTVSSLCDLNGIFVRDLSLCFHK